MQKIEMARGYDARYVKYRQHMLYHSHPGQNLKPVISGHYLPPFT